MKKIFLILGCLSILCLLNPAEAHQMHIQNHNVIRTHHYRPMMHGIGYYNPHRKHYHYNTIRISYPYYQPLNTMYYDSPGIYVNFVTPIRF